MKEIRYGRSNMPEECFVIKVDSSLIHNSINSRDIFLSVVNKVVETITNNVVASIEKEIIANLKSEDIEMLVKDYLSSKIADKILQKIQSD